MSTRTHIVTGHEAVPQQFVNPNAQRFKSQIEKLTEQIDALKLAIETGDLNHLSTGFSGDKLKRVEHIIKYGQPKRYLEQLENEKRNKENPPVD